MPLPLDAIARLAARLLSAPMASVTLVGEDEEFCTGMFGLEEQIGSERRRSLEYSVCKYVVCSDHVTGSGDMRDGGDPELCEHLLAKRFGVRAFLSVPVRNADDQPVGSLTVLDTRPRVWTDQDTSTLLEIELLLRPATTPLLEAGTAALLEAAEARAQQSGNFLSALLDNLAVSVVACDASGDIVLMNRELRRVQGLPDSGEIPAGYAESLNSTVYDADGARLPWERTPLMRAWAGEQVHETDIVTKVPGGGARMFAITAQPIVGADGERQGAVAVAHEVTEIRRVERFRSCHLEVERSLAAATSIGDAAPDVLAAVARTLGWPAAELFILDEASGSLRAAGHWSSWDAEPDDFFGHTPRRGEGATGRAWQTGHPVWIADISQASPLRTPFEHHRRQVCTRNGIRSVIAVPVRDAGTVLGVLTCYAGAGEDQEDMLTVLLDGVADQIGFFVALRRAEQLSRQLARAGDDFISLVGHELRTPITSIASIASLLAEDAGRFAADDRPMIESVARNAASLQQMVDTLLDLAGLDAGHLPLRRSRTDLGTIVERAVRSARYAAADFGVRLRFDDPGRLPLDADPGRLRQVVDDLLANAVNYSPSGGEVVVTAGDDDGVLWLAVSDSGIGTPKEEQKRVFDRFFRGSNVRHHGSSGNGLGLSLARAVLRLHNGTIELADNHPSGTTVRVTLPGLPAS